MKPFIEKKINKNLLESKDFLFGFEVEMIYDGSKIHDQQIRKALKDIHPKIEAGGDGSIRPDGRIKSKSVRYWDSWMGQWMYTNNGSPERTMEIKTPPIPIAKSLEVLKAVFELVNQYGYTNKSCGFHVNFSPIPEKLYSALDPFKFTTDSLWSKIKKDFGRSHSQWCGSVWRGNKAPKLPEVTKLQMFKYILGDGDLVPNCYPPKVGKGADVNFDHYFSNNKKRRRIEVRAFGGEAYHQKFELIKNYCNDIIKTFLKNCEC